MSHKAYTRPSGSCHGNSTPPSPALIINGTQQRDIPLVPDASAEAHGLALGYQDGRCESGQGEGRAGEAGGWVEQGREGGGGEDCAG